MVLIVYGSGDVLCISAGVCAIFDDWLFGYVFDNIRSVL